ncbi:hypothetical protein FVE85_6194 [Porphyridium purpureum]|uniref:RING-type E3 ubiquitin transferase n=1 Tax=Porphyridium purpureum TaxID=35688 RepID=A0A5J4Z3P9_PORPP|nr:hypothetical protein FVE85_6194 [Porphyridium purpureum]|eukprot:POR3219..scf295_1
MTSIPSLSASMEAALRGVAEDAGAKQDGQNKAADMPSNRDVFLCLVCGRMAHEPVVTLSCGHVYCWSCLFLSCTRSAHSRGSVPEECSTDLCGVAASHLQCVNSMGPQCKLCCSAFEHNQVIPIYVNQVKEQRALAQLNRVALSVPPRPPAIYHTAVLPEGANETLSESFYWAFEAWHYVTFDMIPDVRLPLPYVNAHFLPEHLVVDDYYDWETISRLVLLGTVALSFFMAAFSRW